MSRPLFGNHWPNAIHPNINLAFKETESFYLLLSVMQRFVGHQATWLLRSSSAPWILNMKDTELLWTCKSSNRGTLKSCLNIWFNTAEPSQMEFGGDHVHVTRWLPALLAQEADADAAYDLGWYIWLLICRVGRPLRHCQRFGRSLFLFFVFKSLLLLV